MTRAIASSAAMIGVALMLMTAGQASAQRVAPSRAANTFSGSCQLSGSVAFVPPLTNTAQALTQYARATGTCSGTFIARNGRTHQLNGAPVSYQATEYAPAASCNAGTDSGNGTVTFPYGTIGFTISETRVSGVAALTLKGAAGGSALGQANISPSANPVAIAQACAGTGLTQAPIDASAATTPSISG
jgi:hypothetical protein